MSQEASHTLGPWESRQSPSKDLIVQCQDESRLFPPMIATVSRWRDDNKAIQLEAEANARLIAAAPELLEACKAAEKWLMLTQTGPVACLEQLTDAIARAEGRPL